MSPRPRSGARPIARPGQRPVGRPVGRPRGAKGHESKEKILAAAMAVAAREGVDRLTIASVAGKAGTSKTSVLHHFGTRERLFEALMERSLDAFLANFPEEDLSLAERATATIRAFFRPSYRDQAVVTNQILALGMVDRRAAVWARKFLESRLSVVQEQIGIPGEPGRIAALTVFSVVQGASTLWLTSGQRDGSVYCESALAGVRAILADALRRAGEAGPAPSRR